VALRNFQSAIDADTRLAIPSETLREHPKRFGLRLLRADDYESKTALERLEFYIEVQNQFKFFAEKDSLPHRFDQVPPPIAPPPPHPPPTRMQPHTLEICLVPQLSEWTAVAMRCGQTWKLLVGDAAVRTLTQEQRRLRQGRVQSSSHDALVW
jgi:hypothetical protein